MEIDRSKLTPKQAIELMTGSLLLLYVGVFMRLLIISGTLNLYINPRFNLLSELTGWICVFFGLVGIVVAGRAVARAVGDSWRNRLAHTDLSQAVRNFSLMIWFFVLVTLLLPATTLSARMAQQRVGGLSATLEPADISISQKWIDNTDNYDLGEWIKLFAAEPDPDSYVDRSMRSTGFIYHDAQMAADQFLLGRFIIRCCVVDATPAGLLVEWPGWQDQFAQGQWVLVRGKFGVETAAEGQQIIVIPDTVELTPAPVNPYLY